MLAKLIRKEECANPNERHQKRITKRRITEELQSVQKKGMILLLFLCIGIRRDISICMSVERKEYIWWIYLLMSRKK